MQIGIYTEREMEIYIHKNFGDKVSFSGKQKNLTKFGQNDNIGTTLEDVWSIGGVEDLPTSNLITHIASSSGSDSEDIVIEGHTIDGSGNLTFIIQTVTLSGQTKTALSTPLARATRAYNNTSVPHVGTIYIAKDVTFIAGVPVSDVHLEILIGNEQSQKSSTSISQYDYWIITEITASVKRTQTRFVDFFFQWREQGGVFRTRTQPVSVSNSSGTDTIYLSVPLIIPPNSDFRIQAVSSGSTTSVGASAYGVLAIKKSQL